MDEFYNSILLVDNVNGFFHHLNIENIQVLIIDAHCTCTLMVVDITTGYHFNVRIIIAVIFGMVFNCEFVNAVLISSLKAIHESVSFSYKIKSLEMLCFVDYGQC